MRTQVEKTQATIFGTVPDDGGILCPDLGLKWDQSFSLLGVDFTADLSNMNSNFDKKIEEIKEIINIWRYRIMTPLGRGCIAKSLLMPKVAHLSLVLPCLTTPMIKKLENIFYNFIWMGSFKVSLSDSKIKVEHGGLGFPDIKASWMAYKLSWFRRVQNSSATWSFILTELLKEVNPLYDLNSLFLLGTVDLNSLGKKINSCFWSECFSTLKPFMREKIKYTPEDMLFCSLWGSEWFTKNGSVLKRGAFRSLSQEIKMPVDIMVYRDNRTHFLNYEELVNKYGYCNENDYISLKVVVRSSLQKKNIIVEHLTLTYPYRPALLILVNMSLKGCNKWTSLLKCNRVSNNTRDLEVKWENKLGNPQGIFFWNRCYRNVKKLVFSNKLRWFYYQIVRGILKTSKIMNKIKPHISPNCHFCNNHVETILHLFWDCLEVAQFIEDCKNFYANDLDIFSINYSKKDFFFGDSNSILSAKNYFALHLKYYIWITRCKKKNLSIRGFANWLRHEMLLDAFNQNTELDFLDTIFEVNMRTDFYGPFLDNSDI